MKNTPQPTMAELYATCRAQMGCNQCGHLFTVAQKQLGYGKPALACPVCHTYNVHVQ